MYVLCIFTISFIVTNKCTINITTISFYTHYIFQHFYVVVMEFYICALPSYIILKIEAVSYNSIQLLKLLLQYYLIIVSDILKSLRCYNLLCMQYVFLAAYTICNKYGHYCMDIWILYRGCIEYIQGWTYPLLMLFVCWSGIY